VEGERLPPEEIRGLSGREKIQSSQMTEVIHACAHTLESSNWDGSPPAVI
jgi:hypothetical protein